MDIRKGVIDRIEGGHAVLLIGEVATEHIVPVTDLPGGAREGSWLRVSLEGERITTLEMDEEETARVQERIAGKMTRLRRRGRRADPDS